MSTCHTHLHLHLYLQLCICMSVCMCNCSCICSCICIYRKTFYSCIALHLGVFIKATFVMSAALSPGPRFPSSFPPRLLSLYFPLARVHFPLCLASYPFAKSRENISSNGNRNSSSVVVVSSCCCCCCCYSCYCCCFCLLPRVCVVAVLVVVALSSWFIHKTDRCVLIKLIYASIDNNYTADAVPNGSVADIYIYVYMNIYTISIICASCFLKMKGKM